MGLPSEFLLCFLSVRRLPSPFPFPSVSIRAGFVHTCLWSKVSSVAVIDTRRGARRGLAELAQLRLLSI